MTLPILRTLRSSRLFTPAGIAAASSLVALLCAVACSSTNTPAAAAGDDDSDSGTDSGSGTVTPIGNTDASGVGSTGDDDGAISDANASTGCVIINGSYAEMSVAGDGSSSFCPSESDTCTFVTDPSTCKFTAGCAKGSAFNGTVDSSGKATYTQDQMAMGITVPATCVLQFNSDLSAFNGVCNASTPIGTITCDGTGTMTTNTGDGSADAATD